MASQSSKPCDAARCRWGWRVGLAALFVIAATFSAVVWRGWGNANEVPAEIVRVRRGNVLKTLLVEGSVESARNVELKCHIKGGSTLLWVIPDGTHVKQGDELARLDSSLIDEEVSAQTILVEQARAAKIAAERNVSATEISVQEYREGLYEQTRQQLELAVLLAEHNLSQAEHKLVQSRRLFRRGFINKIQLSAEIDGVERARLELGVARRGVQVLDEFTKPKMIQELESLYDAAKATLKAAQSAFALESSRLERLQAQQALCVLRAPQDGLVIHANDPRDSSTIGPQIQEGAKIRDRQTILRLPNLEEMQVKALVHESQLFQMHSGLKARVRVQDHEFNGTVETLANQPERMKHSQSHIKYFAAIVRIDESASHLRPGQTAETEILLARRNDVLTVPVTAVVQQGNDVFAWVQTGQSPERRPVSLGAVNDKLAEISAGLDEGDALISNPRAQLADLFYSGDHGARFDVVQRFGLPTNDELHGRSAAPSTVKVQPQTASGGG
ncbi:MAG TPA: HlyD family efflux transporter periplasmic adaptor subunit [Pirellulales bacterium]|nr:HlyD family efflux transporter periplasmic adaptor subunit [Pirellulales bacterium]